MARQVLVLQLAVVLTLVMASIALAAYDARRDARTAATERALSVARTVADSPTTVRAVGSGDPSAVLQPFAEQVRRDADVDFVTIMSTERTRFTHPDPDRIGERFVGDVGTAPEGGVLTQEYTGTLGPSMRAVVPVLAPDGSEVVALVSVGITISEIDRALRDDLALIAVSAALVLVVGVAGVLWIARRLRRQTHGLGQRELTRMYEYYAAVLGAVREGLLLLDDQGRVQLVNDEAVRLLELPEDVEGRRLDDLGLPPGLVAAARSRTAESDDLYLVGDRMLLVSSSPATWDGRDVGAVVTLRDHTELRAVTGELDVVRGLTESLRSQNHESANRLHTVVSLIETGHVEEAVDFATEELQVAQLMADRLLEGMGDPVVAALLLGKSAEAAERGVELSVEGEPGQLDLPPRDLVTIVGNLVDNALDAVLDPDRDDPRSGERRRVLVSVARTGDGTVRLAVDDNGPGLSEDEAASVLQRGWSTKATPGTGRGLGLALVRQAARRHGGDLTIARSALGGARFEVHLETRR